MVDRYVSWISLREESSLRVYTRATSCDRSGRFTVYNDAFVWTLRSYVDALLVTLLTVSRNLVYDR